MKPIPKQLLIHTVTLRYKTDSDIWDNSAYEEQTLHYVRIEPKKTLTYTKESQQLSLNSILFIDALNSTLPTKISLDDEIIWRGNTYTIKSIDEQFALDGLSLHHYEIGLI